MRPPPRPAVQKEDRRQLHLFPGCTQKDKGPFLSSAERRRIKEGGKSLSLQQTATARSRLKSEGYFAIPEEKRELFLLAALTLRLEDRRTEGKRKTSSLASPPCPKKKKKEKRKKILNILSRSGKTKWFSSSSFGANWKGGNGSGRCEKGKRNVSAGIEG